MVIQLGTFGSDSESSERGVPLGVSPHTEELPPGRGSVPVSTTSAAVASILRMAAAEEALQAEAIAEARKLKEAEVMAAAKRERDRLEAERQEALQHECPICFEQIGAGEMVVSCTTCQNSLHMDCLQVRDGQLDINRCV